MYIYIYSICIYIYIYVYTQPLKLSVDHDAPAVVGKTPNVIYVVVAAQFQVQSLKMSIFLCCMFQWIS